MKKVLFIFLFLITVPIFVFAEGKIEINMASLEQLDEIIGIGPTLAQRIIDDRPFSSVDDLLRVKGIGEKTLQKIKIQGLAYVAGEATQPMVKMPPVEEKPTEAPIVPQTPVATELPQTYPIGVILNEVLPSPEGSDETSEWIELYNTNNFSVDLSGWKLQDIKGTPTTYVFPKNTILSSNGYLVLKRPETKITLNNDEDGLHLALPDEKIIDSMSFTKAPKNQSYNKKASGWQWSTTLTPGAVNIITDLSIQTKAKTLPENQKTDITYLSALSESINPNTNSTSDNLNTQNKSNPWFLFLIALAITIISSIIILILKLKFKNGGIWKSNKDVA